MSELDKLHRLLTRSTGIELERGGLRNALDRYVLARMSELNFSSITPYLALLERQDSEEFERLIDIITVPHTWFFRDSAQLLTLFDVVTQIAKKRSSVSLWIPACATGEDAYSLALLAQEQNIPLRITASDICSRSLTHALHAQYTRWSLRDLPDRFWPHFQEDAKGRFHVSEKIKKNIRFQQHNLMDPPLQQESGWDLILCRNVLIYFSQETGAACAQRLGQSLHSEGYAFFGAGELIHTPPPGLYPITVGPRVAFRHAPAQEPPKPAPWGVPSPPPVPVSLPRPTAPVVSQLSADTPITIPPPSDPKSSLLRGHILFENHDFENATRVYLEAASAEPTHAELRMYAGISLYICGDIERASNELRAALLLNSDLWPAALYSGLCLDSMGVPLQANNEYRHAVRLLEDPSKVEELPVPEALRGFSSDLLSLARQRSQR